MEERALAFVHASPHFHEALWFLVHWPDLDRAADLVVTRSGELDGDLYHILVPAAEALEAKHPLAATLIRRALIDFTLAAARTHPVPPRGAAPAGMPGPRRPDRGLRRLRDPRGLPRPAEGRARSQGVLLEPARLTALPADPPDQEVAAALAVAPAGRSAARR